MTARRFYRARLVKDGPFVPVQVWEGRPFVEGEELDRSPRLQALVGTEQTARAVIMTGVGGVPVDVHGATLRNIEPIKEHVYRFMIADQAHAEEYRPNHPKADVAEPVDFNKLLPL